MKDSKGFTLIELLAVIVILAIIALIAAPVILGIIDDARAKSAEDSAYGLVKSAKLHFTESLFVTKVPEFTTAEITSGRIFDCKKHDSDTVIKCKSGSIELKIDGTLPIGKFKIDKDGIISTSTTPLEKITYDGKYCFTLTDSKVQKTGC